MECSNPCDSETAGVAPNALTVETALRLRTLTQESVALVLDHLELDLVDAVIGGPGGKFAACLDKGLFPSTFKSLKGFTGFHLGSSAVRTVTDFCGGSINPARICALCTTSLFLTHLLVLKTHKPIPVDHILTVAAA